MVVQKSLQRKAADFRKQTIFQQNARSAVKCNLQRD